MRHVTRFLFLSLTGVVAMLVPASALVRASEPAKDWLQAPGSRLQVTEYRAPSTEHQLGTWYSPGFQPGEEPGAASEASKEGCHTPSAPLEIELAPLPRQKGDGAEQQRLRVRVTPRVSAPALEVTLALPSGVTLLRGETRWKQPARAAATLERDLLLQVPSKGEQRIVATARLLFHRSLPMAAATGFTYNEKPLASPPTGPLQDPETLPRLAAPLASQR